MSVHSIGKSLSTAIEGHTPNIIEIPLKPCCRSVFAGEECGCDDTMPDMPPILFDLRDGAVV